MTLTACGSDQYPVKPWVFSREDYYSRRTNLKVVILTFNSPECDPESDKALVCKGAWHELKVDAVVVTCQYRMGPAPHGKTRWI